MTGSITNQLNHQHSTTTSSSTMTKSSCSKLRQCSSADDHNSIELIVDDNYYKEFISLKGEQTTSDVDSGTEEIEQQQLEHVFMKTSFDNEDILSIKSFGQNLDEGFSECEREIDSQISLVKKDLELVKIIGDETKKYFCPDTRVAFHGEFARLISIPLSLYHDVRYYLFAEEEINGELYDNLIFICAKLDNAKAQFKCSNISCQHAWTSMRARISFSITDPTIGFIVLKIFGQNCQVCGAHADALWYIDEVCRVMKNLGQALFERFFPDMLNKVDLTIEKPIENDKKQSRHRNHDTTQRKGKMFAPHIKEHCEACILGLCFA